MNDTQLLILMVLWIGLFIYLVVSKICACVEHCHIIKYVDTDAVMTVCKEERNA